MTRAGSDRRGRERAIRVASTGLLAGVVPIGGVTFWVTRDPALALLVVSLAMAAATVALVWRTSRTLHAKLDSTRVETRALRHGVRRLADRLKATADRPVVPEVAQLRAAVLRTERQLSEEHRELSEQVSALARDVRALADTTGDQAIRAEGGVARILSRLEPAQTQLAVAVPGTRTGRAGPETATPPGSGQTSGTLSRPRLGPDVTLVVSRDCAGDAPETRAAASAAAHAGKRLRRPVRIIHDDEFATADDAWSRVRSATLGVAAVRPGAAGPRGPVATGSGTGQGNGRHQPAPVEPTTVDVAILDLPGTASVRQPKASPEWRARSLHVVTDWDPGALPGSPAFAPVDLLASGADVLMESVPLAAHLATLSGRAAADAYAFVPALPIERLHRAAVDWRPTHDDRPRLLCLASPAEPRTSFSTCVDAVRRWVRSLPLDVRPIVTFFGTDLPPLDLGHADLVRIDPGTGTDYAELLATTDLGLACRYGPHPGSSALAMTVAGVPAVTTSFATAPAPAVDGLFPAHPSPSGLAAALAAAHAAGRGLRQHAPRVLPESLGAPLDALVDRWLRDQGLMP